MKSHQNKYSYYEITIYVVSVVAISLFLILLSDNTYKVDELHHMIQINRYSDSDFSHLKSLTTFTTYHLVIASVAKLFSLSDEYYYRNINLFFSILMFFFFIKITKLVNQPSQIVKVLQLMFLPLILPFYYLVYTDVFALLMLVIAFYYFLLNRNFAVLLFATIAVFVRQPNLIWLIFFPAIIFFEGYSLSLKDFPSRVKRISAWLVIVLMFIIVFVINGGIAMGDKTQHQISFNFSNIFFLILILFVIFVPVFLSKFNEVINLFKRNKWLFLVVLLFYPVYYYGFKVTHDYNFVLTEYFIRNRLLLLINQSDYVKFISYIIFSYTILAISTIKLVHKKWYWLFLVAPLSVIPMPLIEQRYYIVAIVLWQFVRNSVNPKVEVLNFLWCAAISIYLYIGIMTNKFFL